MATQPHDDTSGHNNLSSARLEAFSDGVIAIIITITVLQFKVPTGQHFSDLRSMLPLFLVYVVSFQVIGTYWNNHHYLLSATHHVSATMLWANLTLLFWLSLIPFATGWLAENYSAHAPTAVYAAVLLCCSMAYFVLQVQVVRHSEKREKLLRVFRNSSKGRLSIGFYALAVVAAFWHPVVSGILVIIVGIMWVIPDKRIERAL